MSQEDVWLDKLDKYLKKSVKTIATDAEEISEELDAEDTAKRLEESIEQTQTSENCIAEFQQWLETTDQQLTYRIQNDFSPQDLPNDVENRTKSSTEFMAATQRTFEVIILNACCPDLQKLSP